MQRSFSEAGPRTRCVPNAVGARALIEVEFAGGPPGDPERLHAACLRRIYKLDAQRSRAPQDFAVEGLFTAAELRERLAGLRDQRSKLEHEAAKLRARREVLTNLEVGSVLERYAAMAPEGLEHFTAEDRHETYRALRVKITVEADGSVRPDGAPEGPRQEIWYVLTGVDLDLLAARLTRAA